MREGKTMDMSWQALLQEAAATSFEKTDRHPRGC